MQPAPQTLLAVDAMRGIWERIHEAYLDGLMAAPKRRVKVKLYDVLGCPPCEDSRIHEARGRGGKPLGMIPHRVVGEDAARDAAGNKRRIEEVPVIGDALRDGPKAMPLTPVINQRQIRSSDRLCGGGDQWIWQEFVPSMVWDFRWIQVPTGHDDERFHALCIPYAPFALGTGTQGHP